MSVFPFTFLVQEVIQELPEVRRYRFEFGLTPFEFYAGQFCVVALPRHEPLLTGALSLASSPLRRESFEFAVKRIGNFGTKFYESVQAGDLVSMKAPMGHFILSTNNPQAVTVVAFDYCVTAVRAFWQYLEDTQESRPFHFVHVIHGADHALFYQEFSQQATEVRQYLPYEKDLAQRGLTFDEIVGLVPDVLAHQVFVVGEGPDVLLTVQELKANGIDKQCLHIERWS